MSETAKPDHAGRVVMRILIPDGEPLVEGMYPSQNRIGTMLLALAIKNELLVNSVVVKDLAWQLEFNQSEYVFQVSNIRSAMKVIKAFLFTTALTQFSRLAWQDTGAIVPDSIAIPFPRATKEESTAEDWILKRLYEKAKEGGHTN